MKQSNRKPQLTSNKQYYTTQISSPKPESSLLNLSLASNPFLKSQESYQYLIYMLTEYNSRVSNGQATDVYESMSYQRLHSLICDLAQMETREDQVFRLQEIKEWFKGQDRVICQRVSQGEIRYIVSNFWRNYKEEKPKLEEKPEDPNRYQIPSELVHKLIGPYKQNARTSHIEMEIPSKRLQEYKRKIVNIATYIDVKQQMKPKRILYPMPPAIEEPKEEEPEEGERQGQPPGEQQGQLNADGTLKDGEQVKVPEQGEKQDPNDQMGDMGGFGEDKEQPEEEEPPEEVNDKLAPKHKIYTRAITPPDSKIKFYKAPYMRYQGQEIQSQRAMEERYVKIHQSLLKKQKEDQQFIAQAHSWGKDKSKIQKQLQKKLEEMHFKPRFSLSQEDAPKIERLSLQDEAKYGLTISLRKRLNNPEVQLGGLTLPLIDSHKFREKNIRQDRLKSLKNKFGKMLNLIEYQSRETAPSLCQSTSRRRDLSQILKAHSKSKERLKQIEEITRIKEKMTRGKLTINMKALSQGLVLPEDEEKPNTIEFPAKELLKNPFWVEPAKKKKKAK